MTLSTSRGREVILLVEDEKGIRSLIRRTLIAAGYELLEADGADQALEIAAKHPREIRLLITDSLTPDGPHDARPARMSGGKLAAELVSQKPDLKVLFISGRPSEDFETLEFSLSRSFLQKPFSMVELLERVKRMLGY